MIGPASAAELRSQVRQLRKELTSEERKSLSLQCVKKFEKHVISLLPSGSRIGLYRSLPEEIELLSLEAELQARGYRLHYPRIRNREAREIELVEVNPLDPDHWLEGPYRIYEPNEKHPAVHPSELDWVVVPGVVFGSQGERIGLGGGYYDRFLLEANRSLRIALAFDFQVLGSVPQESWDQRMDVVLTDQREIVLDRAQAWKWEGNSL